MKKFFKILGIVLGVLALIALVIDGSYHHRHTSGLGTF